MSLQGDAIQKRPVIYSVHNFYCYFEQSVEQIMELLVNLDTMLNTGDTDGI